MVQYCTPFSYSADRFAYVTKEIPYDRSKQKALLSIIYTKRKVNIQNHHSFLLSYAESWDTLRSY